MIKIIDLLNEKKEYSTIGPEAKECSKIISSLRFEILKSLDWKLKSISDRYGYSHTRSGAYLNRQVEALKALKKIEKTMKSVTNEVTTLLRPKK